MDRAFLSIYVNPEFQRKKDFDVFQDFLKGFCVACLFDAQKQAGFPVQQTSTFSPILAGSNLVEVLELLVAA